MIKRFGLFALVNIAIMVTISFVIRILGLEPYLYGYGVGYEGILLWSLIWGMGGAFISLMLSKTLAIHSLGLKVIDPGTMDSYERGLVSTVHNLARGAKLPAMPTVALYDSPEINAFATGPSKSNSLVAVSTGLLRNMNENEVNAVLAHEVSHIANGDMVTMTLVQGVVNAFVLFFSKIIARIVASSMRGDERGPSYMLEFMIQIPLQIAFGLLGSIVVNWFSRQREFRADAGAGALVGRHDMIAALERLKRNSNLPKDAVHDEPAYASLKISGREAFAALFSTHPPLEDRISKLKEIG
ncbi:MAG: protease HtpX [Oligoflexales bacterium]|nr:protease HtpX [Oligoflexales bacterium]